MVKFEIEPILKLKICFLNLVFRITYQVPYRGSNPENFSPLSKRVYYYPTNSQNVVGLQNKYTLCVARYHSHKMPFKSQFERLHHTCFVAGNKVKERLNLATDFS